jgi:hypothetical protein
MPKTAILGCILTIHFSYLTKNFDFIDQPSRKTLLIFFQLIYHYKIISDLLTTNQDQTFLILWWENITYDHHLVTKLASEKPTKYFYFYVW